MGAAGGEVAGLHVLGYHSAVSSAPTAATELPPRVQPLSVADFLVPEGEDPASAGAKAGNGPDQVHPTQTQTPTLIRAHVYCCAKATVGWRAEGELRCFRRRSSS